VSTMSVRTTLRDLWASVRPRTRRGGFLSAAAILGGAAVLSVVLLVGAAMAWDPYVEYSLDREVDARSWASLDQEYASAGMCLDCHAPEAAKATTASHEGIGCQSCHGPLLEHVRAGEETDSSTVAVKVPTEELCLRCHVQADGRPASIREIVVADHYVPACLACHDPHSGVSNPPPVVEHPLENLPPCMTCHGPEGFMTRNQRHPVVDTNDRACLDCHLEGRGPEDLEASR
jgi:Cytochrome c554 and c-prime